MTIAQGRHEHLRGQGWGLLHQTRPADLYVVVAMGDPQIAAVAGEQHRDVIERRRRTRGSSDLPLAAARNAGARAAIQAGAERAGLPRRRLHPGADHRAPATPTCLSSRRPGTARRSPAARCATCPPSATRPSTAHPAWRTGRSRIPPVRRRTRATCSWPRTLRLFWSLSFALTGDDWAALGGFDEAYTGYGAEDTDFGQRLAAAGGDLLWVGGAAAYHQHHPTETPPVQHLALDRAQRQHLPRPLGMVSHGGLVGGVRDPRPG